MKKCLSLVIGILFCVAMAAQTSVSEQVPQYSQNPNAIYRLFNSQNLYNFVKLDTRNGKLWQVQWNINGYEGENIISYESRVPYGEPDTIPGRFTLYATTNMYTFLMLDQKNGRVYHVQWSIKPENRGAYLIY